MRPSRILPARLSSTPPTPRPTRTSARSWRTRVVSRRRCRTSSGRWRSVPGMRSTGQTWTRRGPLADGFGSRTRQRTLVLAGTRKVNGGRAVGREAAGVGRRAVVAVEVAPEHPQHRELLAAMVRGVGDAPGEDPGARASGLEEVRLFLPPGVDLLAQRGQPLSAVLGIAAHELDPRLDRGQRRRAHVDPEHLLEPAVLA